MASGSEKTQVLEKSAKVQSSEVLRRLCLNLSEFLLVAIFVSCVALLYSTGLWTRQVTRVSLPSNDWSLVDANCSLSSAGFSSQTCVNTRRLTTTSDAIGRALAAAVLSSHASSLQVTTCAAGTNFGYGTIVFLMTPLSSHIDCTAQPDANLVHGMAVLETAFNNTTPVFLLSTYLDTVAPTTEVRIDTSGDTTVVASKVITTLVAEDGLLSTPATRNHSTWSFASAPLGARYRFTFACVTEFVLCPAASDRCTGRASKQSVQVAQTCTHEMTNALEISIAQAVLIPLTLHLVNGDFLTTLIGLQGALRRQPVLTFDFLSGLERRKIAFVLLLLVRLPALGYVEVTRLYLATPLGRAMHWVAVVMVSGLFVLVFCNTVLLVQRLPPLPRCKDRAIRVNAPGLLLGTMTLGTVVACGLVSPTEVLYDPIFQRSAALPLRLPSTNRTLVTGAYLSASVPSAIERLLPTILGAFGFSLLCSVLGPIVLHRQWVLNMDFFQRNPFLATEFVPQYVTFLPAYEHDCIKYGNKIFVKPSMLALLGYAMLREKVPDSHHVVVVQPAHQKPTPAPVAVALVSIYDLVASILPHALHAPRIRGWVLNYQFKAAPAGTTLTKHATYRPTKGMCIG
ncbi:hypothetical protein SPRG_07578 [Saprolegnia parasitica CBS 223.65]|uniref:Uncharacterized protein n=1 Tax=Saprolegnia parasitica (strain CBS 223.65) TaxID=695850 RepID=A0A067CLB2_SAPPC|nr:hypothetical protein SPRG_07578 [Saprolegnia parasitica CBS 223.65]KDO27331.1 hypothetical protein SPRG_07578 [Saprolegnia parasitica CBS 223.65]|eukprot:XP_012202102.1 hypothetical protein SPRG_07578 [Saprolegnia parasitica CBS 223.65]